MDTTNKIVTLKAKKRAEALRKEQDRAVKIAAQQASSQKVSLPQEKSAATPQGVQTKSTTTTAVTTATSVQNTLTVQSASSSTSSTLQNSIQTAPNSTSALITQSSAQSTTVVSTSSCSNSSTVMRTTANTSTTSSAPVHFVLSTLSCTATSVQPSINPSVHSTKTNLHVSSPSVHSTTETANSQVLSEIPSAVPTSSSPMAPLCTLVHTTSPPVSSVALPVLEEPSSSNPGTTVPVLSSQGESISTNLLSQTVSLSLKMTADSSTTSSVSEAPSITKELSTQILPSKTSSAGEIPSSVVQISSSAPSSTSLVPTSYAAASLSSNSEATLVNDTLASSSSNLHIMHSANAGPSLSSSSIPAVTKTTSASTLESMSSTKDGKSTDCVSEPSAASSVSATTETVNDSVDLLDPSTSLLSSETTSEKEHISLGSYVGEATDVIENCDSLSSVVTSDTDVDTRDDSKKSKLCTEDVSIDCSSKDTSSDHSSMKDTTGMESGKETSEDQDPFSSDPLLNVSDQKSQSAVCKSLDSDQSDICEKPDLMNVTPGGSCAEDETVKSMESIVAKMSSDSIVSLTEKETLVDSHQDTGELYSSLSSSQDVDDFLGSQVLSQESGIVPSEDVVDKKDSKNACEHTTEVGLTKEGQNEKPLSLENQLCKATDGEELKQSEDLTELSDVHVVNHNQENIVHAGFHEATEVSSSVGVIANSNILEGLESLKPKESLDPKDGQIEEKEEEIQSLEEVTLNNDQELRKEQFSSSKEVLLDNQLTGPLESGGLTTENEAKLDDVLLETEKKSNHFEQNLMSGLEEGMKGKEDDIKGNDDDVVVMEDGSIVSNNVTQVENNGECSAPKSSSDNLYPENPCNHYEQADASATEKDICTTASKDEKMESSAGSSSQAAHTSELTSTPTNHYGDEKSTVMVIPEESAGKHCEDNEADVDKSDGGSKQAEGSSCLTAVAQISKSIDNAMEVSSSSDYTAVTTSVTQASVNADPKQSGNQEDEPMDVDVVPVSPMEKSTTVQSGSALDGVSYSQAPMITEKKSASEVAGREEGSSKLSKESLPVPDTTSQTSAAHASNAVSTEVSIDKTASPLSTGTTTSVSSVPPTAVPAMLSSPLLSQQSIPLPSGQVQGVGMTASPSTVPTASTATVSTAKVTPTPSISMQPVVSGVPAGTKTGPQGVVAGGSPMVRPSIQTTLVKGSPTAPVVQNTSVRVVNPQKTSITTRPQGQTTQYVPIGPKPILPSPRPPVQSIGIQGSNVVRVSSQPAAVGQSTVGPVKSIAALVASLPASGATIGPSQLIRLVTPDGRSITLQGSQLAAIAQQARSPLGLAVPKSITLQVSGAAVQHSPVTTVQRTVGTATPGATITVQRPQQQAAQVKTQIVVKPKVVAKPIKEEKFPSLEPLIKDPRALLNRRLAKWPLRHSVKSAFALQKHELKRLGRKAGMKEVGGFVYSSRAVGVNWPAGIPRPSFKVAWRFRTQSLKTLAGAGLQLRVLQSCLKWDEMNVRPPRGNSNTVYTSSGEIHLWGEPGMMRSVNANLCQYKLVNTAMRPAVLNFQLFALALMSVHT